MAYSLYVENFGQSYALQKVKIYNQYTGAPAVIKSSVDGVVISSTGEAQLDENGTLRVFIDIDQTWTVRVDGYNTVFRLMPLFLRENADGSVQYIVDAQGFYKTQLLSQAEIQQVVDALNNGTVASIQGHTGVVTLADLSLDQVDNTRDLDKPISTATQFELDQKYVKPSNGIPASDLNPTVQATLSLASTALQAESVTSVQGRTGDVVITAADLGISGTVSYTASQVLQNPEAVAAIVVQPDTTRAMIGADGSLVTVDNQPTLAAPTLSTNLGTLLEMLAAGLVTLTGTANQIFVNYTGTTVTLSLPQSIDLTSKVVFAKVSANHIGGNGAAPSVVFNGGSGDVVTGSSVTGTDYKALVTFTTGVGCTPNSDIFTLTFATPFTNVPLVEIAAYSRNAVVAQADPLRALCVTAGDTNSVTFGTGDSGLVDSTTYSFVVTVTAL